MHLVDSLEEKVILGRDSAAACRRDIRSAERGEEQENLLDAGADENAEGQ